MATGATQPLRPSGTVSVSASTTSAAAVLAGAGGALLIYNEAQATAFVSLGTGLDASASAAGIPVPAGGRMLIDAGPYVSAVAVVLKAGAGVVYFTRGEGDTY